MRNFVIQFKDYLVIMAPTDEALGQKKGESIGSDSPFWVVIKIEYHRFFGVSKVPISWRCQRFHPNAITTVYCVAVQIKKEWNLTQKHPDHLTTSRQNI
jgi:hypothetical protein